MLRYYKKYWHIVKGLSSAHVELNNVRLYICIWLDLNIDYLFIIYIIINIILFKCIFVSVYVKWMISNV